MNLKYLLLIKINQGCRRYSSSKNGYMSTDIMFTCVVKYNRSPIKLFLFQRSYQKWSGQDRRQSIDKND